MRVIKDRINMDLEENTSPKYVFHLPLCNSYSNGIQILWQFAEYVSEFRDVTIIPFDYNDDLAFVPQNMSRFVQMQYVPRDEDVVVYPESIQGNPLNGKQVCRYILARPYTLNGQWIDYSKGDYLLYYSNVVSESGPYLNIQNKDTINQIKGYAESAVQRKDQVVIYYGKLRSKIRIETAFKLVRNFKNILIVTRKYPNNKTDLYRSISESKLLISLDPLTNLCYEATLLGTPVYCADTIFESEYQNYCIPLYGFISSEEALGLNFKQYPHEKLSQQTLSQFETQVNLNREKVFKTIKEIEIHFINKIEINVEKKKEEDYKFINQRWGRLPIVSGTNFNSIVGYHLIGIHPLVYIIAKIFLKNTTRIYNSLRKTFNLKKLIEVDPFIVGYIHSLRRDPFLDKMVVEQKYEPLPDGYGFANTYIKKAIVNIIWRKPWK